MARESGWMFTLCCRRQFVMCILKNGNLAHQHCPWLAFCCRRDYESWGMCNTVANNHSKEASHSITGGRVCSFWQIIYFTSSVRNFFFPLWPNEIFISLCVYIELFISLSSIYKNASYPNEHCDLRDYISDTTCRFCRKHAWRLTWCISHYHARSRFWITNPITMELFRCSPGLIIDHFFTISFILIVCCKKSLFTLFSYGSIEPS